MQFNSYNFILYFLPIVVILYFLVNKKSATWGKLLLIAASLVFYWSSWESMLVLLASLVINYAAARLMKQGRVSLGICYVLPILCNIGILVYYKYTGFILSNVNCLLPSSIEIADIAVPVGISFYTFQQIAYLVCVHRGEVEEVRLIDYLAYILYFPKILMGPIMDPVDFMAQINDAGLKKVDWENIAAGVKTFSLGLFKKVMLADVMALAVNWSYNYYYANTAATWILTMFFYTFELYFDFSGYCDMATGASLMLNIVLPINFDSPYKSLSIREYWQRWHITLTKFLTKYVYFPLGGSRRGKARTYLNILIVFVVSGIWHGANWTFILWGLLNGLCSCFDRAFDRIETKILKPIRWAIAFLTWNVLVLLFRSESVSQWIDILRTILKHESWDIHTNYWGEFLLPERGFLSWILHIENLNSYRGWIWMAIYMVAGFVICLIPQNNYRRMKSNSLPLMLLAAVAFAWALISLGGESIFVYYNF